MPRMRISRWMRLRFTFRSTAILRLPKNGISMYSWSSLRMETGFCRAALDTAFGFGQPEIWNSDQGAQFTAADFLAPLKRRGIAISMDGRGRALDNVFIERLWRLLKYELIYPGDFADGAGLSAALQRYFRFYKHRRPHQALGYRTPAELFPHAFKRNKSLS
jgi:putative transposase